MQSSDLLLGKPDCLGLTPPYVNRILRQLREEDLVRLGDKYCEVLNLPKVAQMAGFDPAYLDGQHPCGPLDS